MRGCHRAPVPPWDGSRGVCPAGCHRPYSEVQHRDDGEYVGEPGRVSAGSCADDFYPGTRALTSGDPVDARDNP